MKEREKKRDQSLSNDFEKQSNVVYSANVSFVEPTNVENMKKKKSEKIVSNEYFKWKTYCMPHSHSLFAWFRWKTMCGGFHILKNVFSIEWQIDGNFGCWAPLLHE